MNRLINLLTFNTVKTILIILVAISQQSHAAQTDHFPGVWANAGTREYLSLRKAAEMDATRRLSEMIYNSTLAASHRNNYYTNATGITTLKSEAKITGVRIIDVTALPDGRIQASAQVGKKELINLIRKMAPTGAGDHSLISQPLQQHITVLTAQGYAALPGSEGHLKIIARRCALLDGYAKLAKAIMATEISSHTTIRDLALQDDTIVERLSAVLKGTEVVAGSESSLIRLVGEEKQALWNLNMRLTRGSIIETITNVIDAQGNIDTAIEIDDSQLEYFTVSAQGTSDGYQTLMKDLLSHTTEANNVNENIKEISTNETRRDSGHGPHHNLHQNLHVNSMSGHLQQAPEKSEAEFSHDHHYLLLRQSIYQTN